MVEELRPIASRVQCRRGRRQCGVPGERMRRLLVDGATLSATFGSLRTRMLAVVDDVSKHLLQSGASPRDTGSGGSSDLVACSSMARLYPRRSAPCAPGCSPS